VKVFLVAGPTIAGGTIPIVGPSEPRNYRPATTRRVSLGRAAQGRPGWSRDLCCCTKAARWSVSKEFLQHEDFRVSLNAGCRMDVW